MSRTVQSDTYNGKDRRNNYEANLRFYISAITAIMLIVSFSGWLLKTNWIADLACKKSEAAMCKAELNEKALIGLSKDVQYQTELLVKIYRKVEHTNAD